jgi:hypothetical protein
MSTPATDQKNGRNNLITGNVDYLARPVSIFTMLVEIPPETVDKLGFEVDKPVSTLCPTIACDKTDKPQVQILHSSITSVVDAPGGGFGRG